MQDITESKDDLTVNGFIDLSYFKRSVRLELRSTINITVRYMLEK